MSDCQKKVYIPPPPPYIFVYSHLDVMKTKKLGHGNARKTAQEKHRFIEDFSCIFFAMINPRICWRLSVMKIEK